MATRKVTVHLDRIRQRVADHDDPNWPFAAGRTAITPAAAATALSSTPSALARHRSPPRPSPPVPSPAATAAVGSLVGVALGVGAFLAGRQLVRRARRFDLADKLVLITGGSRGLGLLLAREFASAGARVAVCARDEAELERARRQLAMQGRGRWHEVWTGVCDVTDQAQVVDLVGRLRADRGAVDVLVNNAGLIAVGPQQTMTLADYEQAMATNFWGAVHATGEVVDAMRRRGSGRIVNVSSVGGKIPVPHMLPYSASKFALGGWSAGLRAELQQDGVYVTSVFPGLIRTGSPPNATFKGLHRKEYAWFAASDSLPLTSMSADRAARRIVRACVNGEAELTLSWQAKLAQAAYGLFPGTVAAASAAANRWLLPAAGTGGPDDVGTEARTGWQSQSPAAPGTLTALSDRAARANNEVNV